MVFVFALRSSRLGRLALKRTIQLPLLGASGIFTFGELMMLGATTAMASPLSPALFTRLLLQWGQVLTFFYGVIDLWVFQ